MYIEHLLCSYLIRSDLSRCDKMSTGFVSIHSLDTCIYTCRGVPLSDTELDIIRRIWGVPYSSDSIRVNNADEVTMTSLAPRIWRHQPHFYHC